MEIKIINKESFLFNYLTQISKITDSCVLEINEDKIFCKVSSGDNTIILFSNYNTDNKIEKIILNLPDCKKLIKLLSCINSENITFKLEKNCLTYSSEDIKFRYHLLEDGLVTTPKVNVDKVNDIKFDTNFILTKSAISNLIKASSINSEVDKLYLYSNNTFLMGDFTDNSRHNIDSLAIKIATNYDGAPIKSPVPINFEIIRQLTSTNNVSVKYCSNLGVFLFEVEYPNVISKYLITALVS